MSVPLNYIFLQWNFERDNGRYRNNAHTDFERRSFCVCVGFKLRNRLQKSTRKLIKCSIFKYRHIFMLTFVYSNDRKISIEPAEKKTTKLK